MKWKAVLLTGPGYPHGWSVIEEKDGQEHYVVRGGLTEAQARLIAEAPALCDACRAALETLEQIRRSDCPGKLEVISALRAALEETP